MFYKTAEPGLLHDNLHFAWKLRCFTRQFQNSNDNLTIKKPSTGKTKMINDKLSLNMKLDQKSDLSNFVFKIV